MNEKLIWDFLYSKIKNPYGTAALMGNLYVESQFNSKNLQGSYERKLHMTDDEYTEAVDSGIYQNFANDSAGYGLAQWTYSTRKAALQEFAYQTNRSIGDLQMQLEFLWNEFSSYTHCLKITCNAKSVKEASDVIVTEYEKPANQSENAKQNRANYGQSYFNIFASAERGDNMISLSSFLAAIQTNVDRIKAYKLGNDGSNGTCDCIGLIIGAVRIAGSTWNGTHGSNWAWRNAIIDGKYINNEKELFAGEIVFKARNPGDDKYALPNAYNTSSDLKDYYHVGVVTSAKPLCITHCTGVPGGTKKDTTIGNWRYGGKLKYVNYENEGGKSMNEEPLYRAIVVADAGSSVRMRSQPSTMAKVLFEVPIGTDVEVMDVLDGWSQIRYQSQVGYMMTKFLNSDTNQDISASIISLAELRQIQMHLIDAVNIINKALSKK